MDLNRNLSRHPIIQAIHDACLAIEKCGASPELTHAVTLVAALKEQAHCLLDKLDSASIGLPVLDLMSDTSVDQSMKPLPILGAALTSPGLTSGIGAFDGSIEASEADAQPWAPCPVTLTTESPPCAGHATPLGPVVMDAIMAIADEYAQATNSGTAKEMRAELLACINDLRADNKDQTAEIERLHQIIDTPQKNDFLRAVSTEAEHQRRRWGAEHDAGKTPADWFWLVGHLAGKALHAHAAGDTAKAEHHVITTAAALANWHLAMFGKTDMRPGINPERVAVNDQATEAAA